MIAAILFWAFDMQELFTKEKLSGRIEEIREYAEWIAKKIHAALKGLAPYMLLLLKRLLHLLGGLFLLAIRLLKCLGGLAIKLFKWSIKKLKDYFQKIEDLQHQVSGEIPFTFEENLEFAEEFEGKPYESPVFEKVDYKYPFAALYEISAARRAPQYEKVKQQDFDNIIVQQSKKFMAKKRKVRAYVRVIAATSTRLSFAVAFSEYGWNRLLQIYPPVEGTEQQTPPPALEEAIPEEDTAGKKDGGEDDGTWF